ncbi:MAG: MFS transporter [Nocardioidaceae bacterium]|nr:MFS transporter [Nocardioidaceae bacterium]
MPRLTHRQVLTVLTGLMLGMLVAALSQTVVATALPTIVGELGGQDQLAWVVSATLLSSTASTPIWGKLSDLYGRKLMYQSAIWIFIAGSFLAGFSQNMPMLIGSRLVQGLGIGGLMALGQAIIGDIVSPRERGRYQGYMGSTFALATVLGPLIGGVIVEQTSWRWTFFVGIPIGLAALVVTERVLQLPFPRRDHKVDWWGATFIVGCVSSILLVLSLGGDAFGWQSGWTVALVASSLLFLGLAIWQERRAVEPIMPPHLFRNHTFAIAGAAGFAVGVAMFGAMIFLPQYLQIVRGESPMVSGFLTLPLMFAMIAAMTISGRVITRTGRYKLFPVLGMALLAVGLILMSRLHTDTSLVLAGAYMAVAGVGIGLSMQVLVLATQNAVGRGDLGVATSGATFFRAMGGAVGVAMFGALLRYSNSITIPDRAAEFGVPPDQLNAGDFDIGTPAEVSALPTALHDTVVTGFADSMQTVFASAAPFAVVGFLVVVFLREHPLDTREVDPSDVADSSLDMDKGAKAAL